MTNQAFFIEICKNACMELVTYGDRIRYALEVRGKTRKELATRLGCSVQAVGDVINGKSHAFGTQRHSIAVSWLQLSDAWLQHGVGEMDAPNIEPAADMSKKKYPLVSFVQAGGWTEICDNFQPGDADEWYPSAKNLGPHGYMLRVKGKSMYAPGEKYSFPEGMLLHVNPSMEPVPGQFVIVRRNGSQEATFKRYIMIDGEPYLEAINPNWPEKYLKLLPGDDWCGVVVDASMNSLP